MTEKYRLVKDTELRRAVEIILKSPYTSGVVDPDDSLDRPIDDRLLETVGQILQAEGFKVIDDKTDEEIVVLPSYGRAFLSLESGIVPHSVPELKPEFVTSYLEALTEFPDAVINYRYRGEGLSIERPNPDYDLSKGKGGKNPKYVSVTTAMDEARVQRVMDSGFTGLYMDPGKHDRLLFKAVKPVEPKARPSGSG